MLTLFAIPKPFIGHIGVIQRNAVESWTRLDPRPEIFLVGEDEGTKETAEEFGVKHIPDIALNEFGAPMVDSIHQHIDASATSNILCYVNADIILTNDLMRALEQAEARDEPFVMVGQRWDMDIREPLDFGPDWEDDLRQDVARRGSRGPRTGEDYCVFPKGFFADMPAFTVGHVGDDGWRMFTTRSKGVDLIEASQRVLVVHQQHDYSHIPKERGTNRTGIETDRNMALAGGRSHMFIMKDRTHLLTSKGVQKARDGWRYWRILRTSLALHPTMPFPFRWGLKAINGAIDNSRQVLVMLRLIRPYVSP